MLHLLMSVLDAVYVSVITPTVVKKSTTDKLRQYRGGKGDGGGDR